MNISEEEFKSSIIDKSKRVYLELTLCNLINIDFDEIHNKIIIDDPDIVNDDTIPLAKRPYCTIISFSKYIVIVFKNNTIEEKENIDGFRIVEKVSKKYPQKLVYAINFNYFDN